MHFKEGVKEIHLVIILASGLYHNPSPHSQVKVSLIIVRRSYLYNGLKCFKFSRQKSTPQSDLLTRILLLTVIANAPQLPLQKWCLYSEALLSRNNAFAAKGSEESVIRSLLVMRFPLSCFPFKISIYSFTSCYFISDLLPCGSYRSLKRMHFFLTSLSVTCGGSL